MEKTFIVLALVGFAISLAVGILIGVYGVADPPGSAYKNKIDISGILHDEIKAEKIAENLRTLTSVPHLAGTPQDLEQANWMKDRFLEAGLDEAKVVAYEVLLSYPDFDNPNKVHLLDDKGSILFTTSGRQVPLQDRGEFSPLVVPTFNAYSASGEVQGDLVYAYYGRDEDFDVLAARGISVSGKIVLARYGAIFRGNIAKNAEKRGAIGVLLFSDPQNFALGGRNRTYPNNWWMPGMAVQIGTIFAEKGDPLTPRYPSIESAYRIPEDQANLPKIPVQPIGYDEAEHFIRSLSTSNLAPTEWQGNLNATYYLGPLANGTKVFMNITTTNKRVKTYNAIGFLYGEEEPDRYVILGNHRDAWVLGAVDPSSGTASMVELARAFGAVKKQHNWRPRRTLVFCSWGAEEYGLIGSYEWVEEHAKVLAQRAIAYINVDISVEGNYSLRANSVPMLRSVIVDAAKKVRNPHPSEISAGRTTVYDSWIRRMPEAGNPNKPDIGGLGSGSDYTAFIYFAGVPCIDMSYTYQEQIGSYPLYHSLYDSYYLSAMIDPDFAIHQSVTRMWGHIAQTLLEKPVLPLDITNYSDQLVKSFKILKSNYQSKLDANNATFRFFEAAVNKFARVATSYNEKILQNTDNLNALQIRKINDQLMQIERAFIDHRGILGRADYNHIVFSPSSRNSYAASNFPGLTDLMESAGNQTESQNPELWSQIKQHLALIAFFVEAAADSLSDGL